MKILNQEQKGSRVFLEIGIEYPLYKKNYESVFREAANTIKIPGFRPGKAPRNILEQNINLDFVKEKSLDRFIEDNYSQIIKESKIEPVDFPKWKLKSVDETSGCVFNLEVDVQPEVKLAKYIGIKAERKEKTIADADVDDYVNRMLESSAKINEITDRTVKSGDIAELDIEGSINGIVQEALSQRALPILVGDNKIAPGFDQNIEGMSIADEKEFNINLPQDYYIKEFIGSEAAFKVKVKRIFERIIPLLDDEFAKKISSFNSAQEYKADIKSRLEKAAIEEAEGTLKDQILENISSASSVEIPDGLVWRETELMLDELNENLSKSQLSIEDYLNSRKMTKDDLVKELKPSAGARTKAKLVLRTIAEKENFAITDEELDNEITDIAAQNSQNKEDYLKNESMKGYIKDYLLRRKALDLIFEKADIITK